MRALILDFDGTIVDSEPLHERALRAALEPLGVHFDHGRYIGLPDSDAIRDALFSAGADWDEDTLASVLSAKTRAASVMWERGEARAFAGAIELIEEAFGAGLPVAVCTAALRHEAEPVLERLGISPRLAALITADDVASSKPNPACYALTARRIGVAAGECLAVEDSSAGVAAARSAGCRVIAVGHTTPRERLSGAHGYVDALAGASLRRLMELAR